jgi:hypothetical protein
MWNAHPAPQQIADRALRAAMVPARTGTIVFVAAIFVSGGSLGYHRRHRACHPAAARQTEEGQPS